ncbi:MAG: hypothetical protein HY719_13030 [Planctomycetes bacterium]|nr:hypothetical protein [Planctomycetota bacterium]
MPRSPLIYHPIQRESFLAALNARLAARDEPGALALIGENPLALFEFIHLEPVLGWYLTGQQRALSVMTALYTLFTRWREEFTADGPREALVSGALDAQVRYLTYFLPLVAKCGPEPRARARDAHERLVRADALIGAREFDEAGAELSRALEGFRAAEDLFFMGHTAAEWGRALLLRPAPAPAEAAEKLAFAVTVARELGDLAHLGIRRLRLAEARSDLSDPAAGAELDEAAGALEAIGDYANMAIAYLARAELHLAGGDLNDALRCARVGARTAATIRDETILADAARLEAAAQARLG